MTDLQAIRQDLFVALISDTLDAAGLMHQALPAHIRPLDTGQNLNQGGLPGAIFPYQGVDLASPENKIHIFEGTYTWKRFVDAFHRYNLAASVCLLLYVYIFFASDSRESQILRS